MRNDKPTSNPRQKPTADLRRDEVPTTKEPAEAWWLSDDSDDATDEDSLNVKDGQLGTEADHDAWHLDPKSDDMDATWVMKQRNGRQSDAILNCPGCLTTLCLDCQKHTEYHNQWRAMFVMNCLITDKPYMPSGSSGSGKHTGKKRGLDSHSGWRNDETHETALQKMVVCEACRTEVGVVDQDEVYVFFNVFPSNA